MKKIVSTLALASALAVGSASVALAGQPAGATGQGSLVSAVAQAAGYVSGKARGEAVSTTAKQHGALVSAAAKAQGAVAAAAGKARGSAAAAAGQANGTDAAADAGAAGKAVGTTASEPGRLKAAAGQANRP